MCLSTSEEETLPENRQYRIDEYFEFVWCVFFFLDVYPLRAGIWDTHKKTRNHL